MATDQVVIKRALLGVSDKTGLVDFARALGLGAPDVAARLANEVIESAEARSWLRNWDRGPIMGAFRVRACGTLALEQLVSLRGRLLLVGPIAQEVAVPAKLTGTPDRRQRAAHPDFAGVVADIPAVLLGASHGPGPVELSLRSRVAAGTEEALEWQAEKFRFPVAEHALNAGIPTHHSAFGIEKEHDVVLEAIDERLEPCLGFA